ncbi:hypothetical protein IWW34DRAFT_813050 [Fusarium oxysporum f. sp. albedinis]|nr:hypothetical protein IWW34DRAFT_813050 [Fusarium oxysporum f. sp. albedinis]
MKAVLAHRGWRALPLGVAGYTTKTRSEKSSIAGLCRYAAAYNPLGSCSVPILAIQLNTRAISKHMVKAMSSRVESSFAVWLDDGAEGRSSLTLIGPTRRSATFEDVFGIGLHLLHRDLRECILLVAIMCYGCHPIILNEADQGVMEKFKMYCSGSTKGMRLHRWYASDREVQALTIDVGDDEPAEVDFFSSASVGVRATAEQQTPTTSTTEHHLTRWHPTRHSRANERVAKRIMSESLIVLMTLGTWIGTEIVQLTNASEITVSDPDDDIPLKILKYTGESRPTLVQKDRRHSSLKCAGCGSSSHRLNICMKASEHGLMSGCPWCNTLEHSLANCPETKHDLAMQLEVIQMRANMPSFQPTQEWVDVVRAAVSNGHSPPSSFPWTISRGLDRVGFNNCKGLPIDPDTKDWESVQRRFLPFEGY